MEDKKKEKLVVVEEKVGKIIKWIEVILAIMILIAGYQEYSSLLPNPFQAYLPE